MDVHMYVYIYIYIYPPTPVKGSCRRVRFLFLVVIVNLVQLMLSCLLPPFMVPPHDPNRLHRGGEGGSSKLTNWALRTFIDVTYEA